MHEPGWDVFQEDDLIAFKSPVPPFMDFVYGNVTLDRYKKIKAFYQKKPFFWLLSETQEEQLLLDWGFTGPDLTYEMGLDLADYHHPGTHEILEVREVSSPEDHLQWISVAAGWLNMDPSFVDQFFTAWIKTGKYIPYLGFCEGKLAATSLAYLGNLGASLYCLGTLPAFRNRGLGTAVTHACLKAAKDKELVRSSFTDQSWDSQCTKRLDSNSCKRYGNTLVRRHETTISKHCKRLIASGKENWAFFTLFVCKSMQ